MGRSSILYGLWLVALSALAVPREIPPQNPNDHFDRNDTYRRGEHQGERIRTDRQRPVVILSGEDHKKFGIILKKGEVAFANFSDDNAFKIVVLNTNDLSTSPSFLVEEFSAAPTGAHDMWLFKMKPGTSARIITQITDQPPSERLVDSLIFSVEGLNPDSSHFDLARKGMRGEYPQVFRFMSLEDRLNSSIVRQAHPIRDIPIELSQREVKNFFLAALNESHKAGTSRDYHTMKNNCTSEALRILDKVLVRTRGKAYRLATLTNPFFQIFTKWAPLGLICRGVADFEAWTKTPSLNVSCRKQIESLVQGRKMRNSKDRHSESN